MSKIKAILFDNDGTVVDTEEAILASVCYTLNKVLGSCSDADVAKFKSLIGLPSYDQFKEFTSDEDKIQALIETYRKHNHNVLLEKSKNFEGMPQVLQELQNRGYYLGIVTSKLHDVCLMGLEHLGIDNYFKYIQGPDDWDIHKPKPGALTHACEEIGFTPEETMYVGDSIYDLQAGNGAGCETCGVLWGVSDRETLASEHPNYIISNPIELLEII